MPAMSLAGRVDARAARDVGTTAPPLRGGSWDVTDSAESVQRPRTARTVLSEHAVWKTDLEVDGVVREHHQI